MGMFEGLESLGFKDLSEFDLFAGSEGEQGGKKKAEKKEETPMDYLLAKSFECPVCGLDFEDYMIRKSLLKVVSTDTDFRTYYQTVDPTRYDVLVCIYCGYAALHPQFARISDKQAMLVMEKIMPSFVTKEYTVPYSVEHAIERYKLALLCCVVKNAKNGEKGNLCLKIAWLYRDLKDEANEKQFLGNALKLFKDAYASETFPIAAMDENTMQLLIAELARRVGNYSDAKKWISALIVNKNISSKLRVRAEDVRDMIRNR
jgi:hypothetical protein